MSWVVDASVAAKWFFDEELTDEARALIQSGEPLVAPDLILLEVGSVAWKRVQKGESSARHAMAVAAALPQALSHLVPLGEVCDRALELALHLRHPVYDCAYLALSEARDAPFVTADGRLLERLATGDWSGRALALASLAR